MKIFAATALLCLLLNGCSNPVDPIVAIEANIETMEAALADGDSGELTQFLAESFTGGTAGELNLNKDQVRNMVRGYSLRYKHLRVLLNRVTVELDEQEPALAYMTGTVALSGANRLLPSAGGVYTIAGEWQNFDGDWKLRRLTWQ